MPNHNVHYIRDGLEGHLPGEWPLSPRPRPEIFDAKDNATK